MTIEIGPGIELGQGVQIGAVSAFPALFITEIAEDFLVTETGDQFIEE
jgi:hypothetical protein